VAESVISAQTHGLKQRSEARAPAVTRALDLLEILGRSAEGLTLSELSRRLRIPKSTTHYLIYTLAARGYLQKIPWTRQYSLGVRAFNFTSSGIAELQLRQFLAPMIRALAERLSTGVQISVLKGDEGMVIDRVDRRLLTAGTQPGRHFQLHCTAAGKVLIAWLSDAELERLFSNRPLFKFTPNTITDFAKLKEHLEEVRGRRFAVNDEEYLPQRRAVAAPIFDSVGNVISALSVDGTTAEIPVAEIYRVADELVEMVEDISRQIAAE
jgi:IclR family transcriptional regulator, acetate operon repressor